MCHPTHVCASVHDVLHETGTCALQPDAVLMTTQHERLFHVKHNPLRGQSHVGLMAFHICAGPCAIQTICLPVLMGRVQVHCRPDTHPVRWPAGGDALRLRLLLQLP